MALLMRRTRRVRNSDPFAGRFSSGPRAPSAPLAKQEFLLSAPESPSRGWDPGRNLDSAIFITPRGYRKFFACKMRRFMKKTGPTHIHGLAWSQAGATPHAGALIG